VRFRKWALIALLSLGVLAAGCGGAASTSKYPDKAIEFIAPSGAGGGWDTTARVAAKVLNDQKIVTQPIVVQNKAGGGGAVGLAYLTEKKNTAYTINVYSPPLLLINLNGQTKQSYQETTPLAQVMTDYLVFAVKADSPFKTIADVMNQAKKDPKSLKVGGGSAPGSMDHLGFVKAAKVAGVDVKNLPYVSFQGGGEAMTALLGGHVEVITTDISGAAEQARAGKIRILAVTAPNRVEAIKDVPTLKESGIAAEFIVWRGFFGPPGMPADAVRYWEGAFDQMLKSKAWQDEAAKNGWLIEYKNAADFKKFLDAENKAMESLLGELGLLKK
jgi:putative tricarboxylic transport membrane protein